MQAKTAAFEWETEVHCNEERLKKIDDAQSQVSTLLAKNQLAQSALLQRAQTILHFKKLTAFFSSWCRYGTLCKEKQVADIIYVLN